MQKIFLLIGPPRSSRGTIREIITQLLGPSNIASTSALSLGASFGLEPLLGKTVSVMGDARTGDSHDTAVVLDRLLRISGCDPVEVNRKGRGELANVRLRTRFLIFSNEMLNFRDASGAIVSRYLVVRATRTVPPEERDPDLARTIIATELPSILNLAIKGRRQLYKRGRFLQPASAADLLDVAEDLASPVARFVTQTYVLDPQGEETTAPVFEAWRQWALANGYTPGNDAVLGKNLLSAFPQIRKARPREEGARVNMYVGIRRRAF
jgi:putative DNA primase/helicase